MPRQGIRAAAVLVVGLLFSPPLSGASSAYVSWDAKTRTAKIGNPLVERAVSLGSAGHFQTDSFLQKAVGRDWVTSSAPSGEFRIAIRTGSGDGAGPEIVRTGLDVWQLDAETHRVAADGTAELDLRLLDSALGLVVTVHYRCFADSPVIRSWLDVANVGSDPVTVTAADAFSLRVKGDGETPVLFWVNNFSWSNAEDGFRTNRANLTRGSRVTYRTGVYGTAAAWFALRGTSAGDGLFGGWEWSGSGSFSFEADSKTPGLVILGVGLEADSFSHVLRSGESVTAPAGFVGFFSGGWDGAALVSRRLVENHYAPPLPDPTFPWVGFDTWGYGLWMDEGLVHDLIDRSADLGSETFTLDAGWAERLGDWHPRAGLFDAGIAALSSHAHERGMRFGLWIAFGVADPESEVVRTHPDWVATIWDTPIPADMGSVALCLANPEAKAWAISELDRIVTDYGVDWLLHDFGVIAPCSHPGHGHQTGDGEWATTAAYYEILDEIRRRHPKLVVENCWNGGSLFDFGMLPRHDTSNTNDTNAALMSRQAAYGATYLFPPRYVGKYIADDGTPADYRFTSGILGGPLFLMGRPTEWDAATTEAAVHAVELFKKVRPVMRDGILYRLTGPPSSAGWDAFMSYDAAEKEGYLFAFRGNSGASAITLLPQGLSAADTFRLFVDPSLPEGPLVGGEVWMVAPADDSTGSGIRVRIPNRLGAAVIRFSITTARERPKPIEP